MCDFMIILHIVSLSVGITFTPSIGCTTISWALRTQTYCTHYRWIFFFLSFDLGQIYRLLRCAEWRWVVLGAGECAGIIPQLRMTCSTSCGVCYTSNLWRACGMIKARASSFKKFCHLSFLCSPNLPHFQWK